MASPLFDHYKAALRRGHAAVLRGDLPDAIAAYGEAARLVPDRALPHASLGTVLYRLGRTGEAEAAFEMALRVDPDDASTLTARATARREVGLAADAAADLERLATLLEAHGRRVEALERAREAAHLAPSAARTSVIERLAGPAPEPESVGGTGWPAIDLPSSPTPPPALDTDPEMLLAEAATLLDAGDRDDARDRMLRVVAIHRAAGRPDAALDVCFQLLAIAPGDAAVHLAIAGLQLDRGWQSIAADKIGLLLRLAELTGDTQVAADAHALAAERLRDEPTGASTGR